MKARSITDAVHHESSPLDFDGDGHVSASELAKATLVALPLVSAAVIVGILLVSAICG